MKNSSRKFIMLFVFILALTATYFYLRHRRTAFIENESSDSNLLFRNPSENDLLVYLNKDSFDVPANSLVYYAVNSNRISQEKTHIRTLDLKTRKIISDTICLLSKDIQDYFINPTHTNYIHWNIPYMVAQQVNETTFQAIGNKIAWLPKGRLGNDTTSTNALVVDSRGIPDPTKRIVETTFTPEESDKGIVHHIYVLTRADYNMNIENHIDMKEYRKIFWTEEWNGYFFPEKIMKQIEPGLQTE
jgi:hypothetical protein